MNTSKTSQLDLNIAVFYVRCSAVTLSVSMRGYQLDIALTLPDEFHNITLSGLFGNFNDNPDDDLINAHGAKFDSNSSEETIYRNFGETCK